MSTDVLGGIWLDEPFAVLALVSVIAMLFGWAHLCWDGDVRQMRERLSDGFGWIGVILQSARLIGVVGAHIEMAVAGQVEQNDAPLAGLACGQRLVNRRANRVR